MSPSASPLDGASHEDDGGSRTCLHGCSVLGFGDEGRLAAAGKQETPRNSMQRIRALWILIAASVLFNIIGVYYVTTVDFSDETKIAPEPTFLAANDCEERNGRPCKWWPRLEGSKMTCVQSAEYPDKAQTVGTLFDSEIECRASYGTFNGPSVFRGDDWKVIDIVALFGPPEKTSGKGLIVVPGHNGDPMRREIVRNNTRWIPFQRFDCVVFMYARVESTLDGNDTEHLDFGGCKVVLKQGRWIDFLMMPEPGALRAAGYATITFLIDDVLIAPASLVLGGAVQENIFNVMSQQLAEYDLSAVSPSVFASDHPTMSAGLTLDNSTDPPRLIVRRHPPRGYAVAKFLEIQLLTLRMTPDGWPCYHGLFDPVRNGKHAYGYDLCYRHFCNASLGLTDAAAIHYGRPSAYGGVGWALSHNWTEAERHMHEWMARYRKSHARLSDWPTDPRTILNRCKS